MDLPLLKKRYHTNFMDMKRVFYRSRYRNHLRMVLTHDTWQQSYILIIRIEIPKNQGFLW